MRKHGNHGTIPSLLPFGYVFDTPSANAVACGGASTVRAAWHFVP
ncbi:hypothetical protein [Brasilonema sennae]|nr:hypothetical protein [Brasilonema sennae]